MANVNGVPEGLFGDTNTFSLSSSSQCAFPWRCLPKGVLVIRRSTEVGILVDQQLRNRHVLVRCSTVHWCSTAVINSVGVGDGMMVRDTASFFDVTVLPRPAQCVSI
jgi:hypothetical protein